MQFIKEKERIFFKDKYGKLLAEITFPEKEEGVFCIDHTFVDPSQEGKGIAGELMKEAVSRIKECGGKVEATCSYAQHWIKKHPDEI